jgi:hypothetical protein
MVHFKLLKRKECAKLRMSRKRMVIKIRAKINEIETKNTIQKVYTKLN